MREYLTTLEVLAIHFVDGNKRTAFAVTYTFLALNGLHFRATPDEIYSFIINLYEKKTFDRKHLSPWLKAHTSLSARLRKEKFS